MAMFNIVLISGIRPVQPELNGERRAGHWFPFIGAVESFWEEHTADDVLRRVAQLRQIHRAEGTITLANHDTGERREV